MSAEIISSLKKTDLSLPAQLVRSGQAGNARADDGHPGALARPGRA
jgi:hypothetical protein